MEACRGQIPASNYIAADSRALIVANQATFNRCKVGIPPGNLTSSRISYRVSTTCELNARLKIVMGDIAVTTMIVEMADCDKKLPQLGKLALLHCTSQCTKKASSSSTLTAYSRRHELAVIHVSWAHAETFTAFFEGVQSSEASAIEFVQRPIVRKTKKCGNLAKPWTQVRGILAMTRARPLHQISGPQMHHRFFT